MNWWILAICSFFSLYLNAYFLLMDITFSLIFINNIFIIIPIFTIGTFRLFDGFLLFVPFMILASLFFILFQRFFSINVSSHYLFSPLWIVEVPNLFLLFVPVFSFLFYNFYLLVDNLLLLILSKIIFSSLLFFLDFQMTWYIFAICLFSIVIWYIFMFHWYSSFNDFVHHPISSVILIIHFGILRNPIYSLKNVLGLFEARRAHCMNKMKMHNWK